MSEQTEQPEAQQSSSELAQKKYLKIGEAADLLRVKPHVLRYWESEFPQIKPVKSRTGQRLYRRQDVDTLKLIQELLYVKRFTIVGAKKALRLGTADGLKLEAQEDTALNNEKIQTRTSDASIDAAKMDILRAQLIQVRARLLHIQQRLEDV